MNNKLKVSLRGVINDIELRMERNCISEELADRLIQIEIANALASIGDTLADIRDLMQKGGD